MLDLFELARLLAAHPAVAEKAGAHSSATHAAEGVAKVRLGDDCAAIANPSGAGHLLFAAEGLQEPFVEDDPWFAGYSAVMINLSDIAGMGGRPIAITDIIWMPSDEVSSPIWQGMQAAADAYGVPIVGGHTTRISPGKASLGAAVLGHASDRLISSFEARPDQILVMAVDLHGGYHGDKPFWNSSNASKPERLRAELEMLPSLAEKGLCRAGRHISNGGLIGTLAVLCNCSGVGAILDLEDVPCPMDVEIEKWLVTFPSFGFLLAISPEDLEATMSHFTASRITCRPIGRVTSGSGLTITADGQSVEVDFNRAPALAEVGG